MARYPSSYVSAVDLMDMFKKQLELSKVKEGETIVIFTDTETDPLFPEVLFTAAEEMGAQAYQMTVPATMGVLKGDHVVEAWKEADMVIGISGIQWLYSEAHNQALESGTRTLMVHENPENLKRLFPKREIAERCERGAELITEGKELMVTSEHGTDFTASLEGVYGETQYGFSDIPGRWDHWPSGMVACNPVPGTSEGKLVFAPGDMCLPMGLYFRTPIECTLEDGFITEMKGDVDADLVKDFMDEVNDRRAYKGPAHIGWGCDERFRWSALQRLYRFSEGGMDAECFYGNVLIAFGRDLFGGRNPGSNDVELHVDFPCRNMNFYIDDELIVSKGEIVHPKAK